MSPLQRGTRTPARSKTCTAWQLFTAWDERNHTVQQEQSYWKTRARNETWYRSFSGRMMRVKFKQQKWKHSIETPPKTSSHAIHPCTTQEVVREHIQLKEIKASLANPFLCCLHLGRDEVLIKLSEMLPAPLNPVLFTPLKPVSNLSKEKWKHKKAKWNPTAAKL